MTPEQAEPFTKRTRTAQATVNAIAREIAQSAVYGIPISADQVAMYHDANEKLTAAMWAREQVAA